MQGHTRCSAQVECTVARDVADVKCAFFGWEQTHGRTSTVGGILTSDPALVERPRWHFEFKSLKNDTVEPPRSQGRSDHRVDAKPVLANSVDYWEEVGCNTCPPLPFCLRAFSWVPESCRIHDGSRRHVFFATQCATQGAFGLLGDRSADGGITWASAVLLILFVRVFVVTRFAWLRHSVPKDARALRLICACLPARGLRRRPASRIFESDGEQHEGWRRSIVERSDGE